MIICNLEALLKERKLKISKVSADTKISRTTLTALCNNTTKGIQFDTANTLCIYLNVDMSQLFTSLPFDITVEGSTTIYDDPAHFNWGEAIQLKYFDRKKTEFPVLKADVQNISFPLTPSGDEREEYFEISVRPLNEDSSAQTWDDSKNTDEENQLLIASFQSMPFAAIQIVKDRIGEEVTKDCSCKQFYVLLPDELKRE